MGWSCSSVAHGTMEKLTEACRNSTESSNVFRGRPGAMTDGAFYFFETSNKEHDDGSITGSVLRMTGANPMTEGGPAYPVGSFKIDGRTGELTRAPAVLKALLQAPATGLP